MIPVDIGPSDLETVRRILYEQALGLEVRVFGSRLSWTARGASDLDLALMTTEPLDIGRMAALKAAFTESDLPFRVDIVDWASTSESFRKVIEREHVVLAVPEDTPFGGDSSGVVGRWPTDRFERLLVEPVRNGIYKRREFHGRGAKIVNMGELFAHPRLRAVPMKRVELSESEADRFLITAGDLLFARRSLVAEGAGKCCVVLDVDEPTTFESSIIRARPDSTKADHLYLYYFFNSPLGLYRLDTIRRQVAVAGITGSDLAKLDIPVPPPPEQRAIAHILGTLDDKIELNRRMNETLEAMARALFKSWFVDFDPVRAKLEGRDTGLPNNIADLFPDQMVESELGEIPEGWKVGCLADIAVAPRRGIDPTDLRGETPYIGLEHMPRRSIALTDWEGTGKVTSNKSFFEKGEFLFGKLRPYFHKVGIAPISGVCSTDIVVIAPRSAIWSAFLLATISSVAFVNYTDQTSTGTKMPRTSWKTMSRYAMCLPTDTGARAFQKAMGPILAWTVANIHENRTLAVLRETLLPKLISGEIRARHTKAQQLIGHT